MKKGISCFWPKAVAVSAAELAVWQSHDPATQMKLDIQLPLQILDGELSLKRFQLPLDFGVKCSGILNDFERVFAAHEECRGSH